MAKDLSAKIKEEFPEFAEECVELNIAQINNRLAKMCQDAEATRAARDEDSELEKAKEVASEMGAPYRDALKTLSLKTKYLVQLLKERGGQ